MPPARRKLGEILLELGALDPIQLKAALAYHEQWGVPFGQAVLEKRFCSRDDITKALSIQTGLPFFDLEADPLDNVPLSTLPLKVAERHRAVPLRLEGKRGEVLVVAMAAPASMESLDELRNVARKQRVQAFIVHDDDLDRALRQLYYNEPRPAKPKVDPKLARPVELMSIPNERVFDSEPGEDIPAPLADSASAARPATAAPGAKASYPSRPSSPAAPPPVLKPPGEALAPARQVLFLLGWEQKAEQRMRELLKATHREVRILPDDDLGRCSDQDVIFTTTLALQAVLPAGRRLPKGKLIVCGLEADPDLSDAKALGARMYLRPPLTAEKLSKAVDNVSKA